MSDVMIALVITYKSAKSYNTANVEYQLLWMEGVWTQPSIGLTLQVWLYCIPLSQPVVTIPTSKSKDAKLEISVVNKKFYKACGNCYQLIVFICSPAVNKITMYLTHK